MNLKEWGISKLFSYTCRLVSSILDCGFEQDVSGRTIKSQRADKTSLAKYDAAPTSHPPLLIRMPCDQWYGLGSE